MDEDIYDLEKAERREMTQAKWKRAGSLSDVLAASVFVTQRSASNRYTVPN
jgi:hypothetical protein